LLTQTSIKTDIVMIGVDDKVEIWSKAHYDKVNSQNVKQGMLEKLADKLYKSGETF
jgi:DNA-binding transcriptional regulator/RsmH inhibitor MraZ